MTMCPALVNRASDGGYGVIHDMLMGAVANTKRERSKRVTSGHNTQELP